MRSSARPTFLLIVSVIAINSLLWLDSLDGYFGARYHVQLTSYLPESLFAPSRYLAGTFYTEMAETDFEQITAPEVRTEQSAPGVVGASVPATLQSAVPAAKKAENMADNAVEGEHPRVLFAGDSMMQGVAPLVISSLRKNYPNGFFSDQSRQSTGLTVKRYFDWPTKIKDEVTRQNFDTVIIFLGPNDPWDIYEDGKRYIFPSDDWVEKYRSRVSEVLEFSRDHNVKVIWVGLPNMRDDRVKKGAVLENQVFREETAKFGFDFFPTEPIIGRLDEPFKKHIDDPDKGKVAVRADDGIHFTPTGLRLISSGLVDLLKTRWH